MPSITLAELEEKYSASDRRLDLLTRFKEELEDWRVYLGSLRIWLFGSFLTEKEEPDDIDVLLAGRLKAGSALPPKLPRKHKKEVHVIQLIGFGKDHTKDELVKKFNEEAGNVEKGIQLALQEVIELVLE